MVLVFKMIMTNIVIVVRVKDIFFLPEGKEFNNSTTITLQ